MPLSIGVNLRVTGHCNQGGRKYMEDMFSVAYQQSSNDRELEYAFFGIFDGHGGGEAATFAKENLMDIIVKQKNFWSDNDEDVLKAIRDGYVNTHYAMWRELDKWPRTASGLPSTAGTTASIAFIRKGKIYIGHVGDSGIILGYQEKGEPLWRSKALTKDHKPDCGIEMTRIQESGGKVISKSGVPRVVWNRPRLGHKGPVRRSTHIDEIPFLAVARSLGDLWSYNSELNTFVVSPEPDVKVVKIDVKSHRCLIFGTDGLWNMLSPQAAVNIVQAAERHNEKHLIASQQTGNGQGDVQMWINPSKSLVDRALDRWSVIRLRADNTSVVTLMLDPPGPTHSEMVLSHRMEHMASVPRPPPCPVPEPPEPNVQPNESMASPYTCTSPKTHINPPDPMVYSYPVETPPPSYSEVQKQPDSSNHVEASVSSDVLEKEESTISTILEESIQVAEISSSIDERLVTEETTVYESETTVVESSMDVDTKFVLERENWLQQVPEAEKFPEENADLQPIRFTEPQGPKLRRSVEGSTLTRRMTSVVIRQTNRRRHSTGAPPSKQQQRQRRSLTPKSASTSATFVPGENKLKRSSKVLMSDCEFEEPRVGVGTKVEGDCGAIISEEPCLKRKTRSEDIRNMQDENNPANQKVEQQHSRMRWPDSVLTTSAPVMQERRLSSPNSFKRRNLEKKVTPVKTIRRPSINRSTSRIQMRENFWDQKGRASRTGATCSCRQSGSGLIGESITSPKRWLRSDTIAATPIKTLRSRNVDIAGHTIPAQIAHQYGTVKSNRVLETKLKQPSSTGVITDTPNSQNPSLTKVKPTNCTPNPVSTPNRTKQSCNVSPASSTSTSSASISKRAKTPYNPSARSLSTRSRIKRFSK